MEIKQAHISDEQKLLRLWQQLKKENPYVLYKTEKREKRGQQQNRSPFLLGDQQTVFFALTEEQAIGYILLAGTDIQCHQHVAQITIGVLPNYQRQGVGSELMQQGKKWAVKQGIRRLELTVASQNTAAIAFYLQHHFVFEGIRKQSFFMGGEWQNELYMACLLGV